MLQKLLHTVFLILLATVVTACQQDEWHLPEQQQALLGRAVNFNPSIADQFSTRATSYTSNDNGSFNQNDRMRIYRNYLKTDGTGWEANTAYRTYYLMHRYAAGNINLGTDWLPEAGRKGYDDLDRNGTYEVFTQKASDSLTWDNGRSLRFRAWSQSNFHNSLRNASKSYFYPDFCIADWVNASGPTEGIPLVLNHQGARICFKVKASGNAIQRVEICANIRPDGSSRPDGWKDYKYPDNHDTTENDNASTEAGKTDEQAQRECEAVTQVYRRMCMPAGVNIDNGTLKAVDTTYWNHFSDDQVRRLEEQPDQCFLNFGACTTEEVETKAKRPFFCGINGGHYFITIPYDMCNCSEKGNLFVLPPYTRFRVYLYDVNDGDEMNSEVGKVEGTYHIFSLDDVVKRDEKGDTIADANGNPIKMFPNGLKMEVGVSYTFTVGYRYNAFYVVVDKNLSWTEQDAGSQDLESAIVERPISTPGDADYYQWWKKAIADAIAAAGMRDYNPVFEISSEKEFLEFINLVNGTAATRTSGLYRLVKTYTETIVGGQVIREPATYGWSRTNDQKNPEWVTEEEAEQEGYIFYDRYYPANADRAAYTERDYLRGPFPFYDDDLRMNFQVKLNANLDLSDWALESIGSSAATPFMGKFDGQGHTLSNVYMRNEQLFGYVNGRAMEGASITNLCIESTHPTALLHTAVNPTYIAGISLLAPSSGSSIATVMQMEDGVVGTSYVVGCIHVGDAGGALVGTASSLNMFGCMQAARGISGGALIGADANATPVFKPQISLATQKSTRNCSALPSFRTFMCNFYDTELSPQANAVGTTPDDYSLLEYIRGRNTDILRAKNDFLTHDVEMSTLINLADWKNYYGLAPWHAMNYAIRWYNANRGANHPCRMHFESNTVGYQHRYPTLLPDSPGAEADAWNPIEQPN